MAIQFTEEQERVISLKNKNILVSAAAGSGKTAVLTERIVRMVCDADHPVDIDRLLIMTFTKAAAAEMRERIDLGISAKMRELQGEEGESAQKRRDHVARQAALLHNAQITTIDSFCLSVLRNHFHEIGLDPAFRTADENEVGLMMQDCLAELLEDRYAEGEKAFLDCVEFFCPDGKEKPLEDAILQLFGAAESSSFPEFWLRSRKNDYLTGEGSEFLGRELQAYLENYIGAVLEDCLAKYRFMKQVCEEPDGPYAYGETIEAELEAIGDIAAKASFGEWASRIPNISFAALKRMSDTSVDPEKKERVKAIRTQVKGELDKLAKKYFRTSDEVQRERAKVCGSAVNTLVDLTLDFRGRLVQKKAEKKIVDFADMEHLALEVFYDLSAVTDEEIERYDEVSFCPPLRAAAKEYSEFFQEILVDEYQDSNFVQEKLIRAISGERCGKHNCFMVGDIKQSIYGFRQAKPELFLEKYKTYCKLPGCERIDLCRNYRSREQVVASVNGVFGGIMSEEKGGIVYDDAAKLYACADYPKVPEASGGDPNRSEILLVEKPGAEEDLNSKRAEAAAIADRIRSLRESFRVTDKHTGCLRELRYSDVVILLRSNKGWDEEFKEVLEEKGIPAFIESKEGYFASIEVQELLQTLRVIDNPAQDIPLYGMLHSVFGGFTEEEIAMLSAGKGRRTLCEAIREPEKSAQDAAPKELRERAERFMDKLARYREYAVYMPIRELLQTISDEHDYLNYVTAMPAGSKRRANVEMLFVKAAEFAKSSFHGLFHFVRYMELLEKYHVDYGEADLLDENADVVRIMSIHKSKGLEFPVTFVAGLGKKFNDRSLTQNPVIDDKLGIGVNFVDAGRRVKADTLRKAVIAQKMKEENRAEEMRVLYVAMTRAREKLILTATLDGAEEKLEKALQESGGLDYYRFVNAGSYLDFLLPVIGGADFEINVVNSAELGIAEIGEQLDLAKRKERIFGFQETEEEGMLRQKLQYVYPHKNLERLFTKTSVSELKAEAMEEKDEAAHELFAQREHKKYVPQFRAQAGGIPATERGNAFHRAMEILDFEDFYGHWFDALPESFAEFSRTLAGRGTAQDAVSESGMQYVLRAYMEAKTKEKRLKERYFVALNFEKLAKFLQSEYAYRMWRAQTRGELYREQPFMLGVDAKVLEKRFEGDAPEGETLLIQGIIDVFWIEDGEACLLDYKTDRVDSIEELWTRYGTQMDYYSQAITRIRDLPMKEKILYSFYLDDARAMI